MATPDVGVPRAGVVRVGLARVPPVARITAPEPETPFDRSLAARACDPPNETVWPAMMSDELAKFAFGSATMRALGNVPAVMFVALVVSVVALGAKATPAVLVQEMFGTVIVQSPAKVKPANADALLY